MTNDDCRADVGEPTLEQKVGFLSQPGAYPDGGRDVVCIETHMSVVFLVGDRAYKLKKPVRFPYLDFSTKARRETACRAELTLNRRLAPGVYLAVVPLRFGPHGLSLDGEGSVVDWLVVMRRLEAELMLDRAILEHRIDSHQLDRVIGTLADFYHSARRALISPTAHVARWRNDLAQNHHVLLNPRLPVPSGLVRLVEQAQRRFLAKRSRLLVSRVLKRRIVEGHGDLRPEHIFIGEPLRIIDCLEFNVRLRTVDPFDEIAYLSIECERLGAHWIGPYIRRRIAGRLRDRPGDALFTFYRCYRATLRARLAIAHLLEADPRTPDKWLPLARSYLQLAAADARRLNRSLSTPKDRSARARHAGGRSSPRAADWPAARRSCR